MLIQLLALVGENKLTTVYDLIVHERPDFVGKDEVCKGGPKGKSKGDCKGNGAPRGDSACKLLHHFYLCILFLVRPAHAPPANQFSQSRNSANCTCTHKIYQHLSISIGRPIWMQGWESVCRGWESVC